MTPRRLGQHFLADVSWRARIVQTLSIQPSDIWIEIGAGHGEMTAELARRAKRVVAVELDPQLVERLRRVANQHPNVEVVAGDVLALDLPHLARAGRFKVFGNLPYYITSPILRRLFESVSSMDDIFVVIQFEVAARIAARPGRRAYGYLSALAQMYSRPRIRLRIPPGAFRPRPKVTSALVQLEPPGERAKLDIGDEPRFLEFVQTCFHQKRKTLRNNLLGQWGAEKADAMLAAAGLGRDARAEQLSLAQFAELFRRARYLRG